MVKNVYVENSIYLPALVDNRRAVLHSDKYNCRKDPFYFQVERWESQIQKHLHYPWPA